MRIRFLRRRRRRRKRETRRLPPELSPRDLEIVEKVTPYTMTTGLRIQSLIKAVQYVHEHRVPGALVECGVWRGGSMMAVAYKLLAMGGRERELYLYDTFQGMTPPGDRDRTVATGEHASDILIRPEAHHIRAIASLAEVRENMGRVGYEASRIHYVVGPVEQTIPDTSPKEIALLRLDTDWYESTRQELEHLFPRLVRGGVLILDDYGWWEGAREATDEYFRKNRTPILLNIIDSGRIAVKL